MRMEERRKLQRRATPHRELVLEAVATSPSPATYASVVRDCQLTDGMDFGKDAIHSMVDILWREGLLAKHGTGAASTFTIQPEGLAYLTKARFDVRPPEPGTPRPKARKPRKGGLQE